MTTLDKIEQKKNVISQYCRNNGISYLGVFGSVARGEESKSSDIDFVVDLDSGKSLLQFAKIKLDFERMFSKGVDLAIRKNLKNRIKKQIISDTKEIFNESEIGISKVSCQ